MAPEGALGPCGGTAACHVERNPEGLREAGIIMPEQAVYLVGPSSVGKSFLSKRVAKGLSLPSRNIHVD